MFDQAPLPPLTLVLGGARSGKSTLAERWVEAEAKRRNMTAIYLATGRAWDGEMAERIAIHKSRRGDLWETIEEPVAVAALLPTLPRGQPVLLDCLTLWLTNQMLEDRDAATEAEALAEALAHAPGPVVCVSNEVGLGLVPETPMGRAFRDEQGRLNQRIAAIAQRVVFTAAGLPLTLKSEIAR